jgi:hypothetical protein
VLAGRFLLQIFKTKYMKFNILSTKEILDFEQEIGVELVVNERKPQGCLPKFFIDFENGEVMENGMLIGKYGNGNTIDEALINYCHEISGRRIAINPTSKERREIEIPKLIHTKLMGR